MKPVNVPVPVPMVTPAPPVINIVAKPVQQKPAQNNLLEDMFGDAPV